MDNTQNQRQIRGKLRKLCDSDDVSKGQETQPNYADRFPDELLLKIFKYVPQPELGSVALACHRFNCIVEDRSLWKRVNLRVYLVDVEQLMRRPVQRLSLHYGRILSLRPALEATQSSWCLKELCLHYVEIFPADLVRMFNKCRQLTKVKLEFIPVNNDVFVALSENKNIENLTVRRLVGLEPDGLEILLRNVRKLQKFHIEGFNRYWPLILDSICENLAPSLLHLNVGLCFDSLTDRHIARIAKNLPLLQNLDLSQSFTAVLSARSTESLRNLKHLRILKMSERVYFPPEAYLPLTTDLESLVELYIWNDENVIQRHHIETMFKVDWFRRSPFRCSATFKTSFGVVKLTY